MGFRFNKRVKICKGVTVNLGKKGASLSVGTKGYRKTFSKNGTRTTVGIPGTGISYTDYKKHGEHNNNNNSVSAMEVAKKVTNDTVNKIDSKIKEQKDSTMLKQYSNFVTMFVISFIFAIIGLLFDLFTVQMISAGIMITGLVYILVFNRQVLQCQMGIYYYNKNNFHKSLKYCEKALRHRKVKDEVEKKANEIKMNMISNRLEG